MIADVALNLPLERTFHYLVPEALRSTLQPGMRVLGPFGPRERQGVVIGLLSKSPIRRLKPLRRVLDPVPVIAEERWDVARWMAAHYACSLGEALAAMVPAALRWRPAEPTTDAPAVAMPGPALTAAQAAAFASIQEALSRGGETVLLHGVTGSGKTELYLRAIEATVQQGGSAICLVPEIALTPQTIDRFRARFGGWVAVWHSRMTARQRGEAWAAMQAGRARIVVGARSAVFAPLPRVRLIVVDEEHERTYKQEDVPRYHARDVALARARLVRGTVLLGSATPAVESYERARQGRWRLLELPERVHGRPLAAVEVVDLRNEFHQGRRVAPLSRRLEAGLEQVVGKGEQAMLLLNRRGFARSAQCQACGVVLRCGRCAVPLIYHAAERVLVCHYCNRREALPEVCPSCRKGYLRLRGSGTERVESELHRLFPGSAIRRMDLDTTRGRESHRDAYEAVKQRQVGLLVGTQMIAKGLDFPDVTLVGIVSADTELNLPDFRAGERTFDLLTQMAGRAGRGERPGRVIIQTYCPGHYAVRAAARQDYPTFFREEIAMRRQVGLPPFTHLVELTVRGSRRESAWQAAEALAGALGQAAQGWSVLGPAPHRIPRLRRAYQMCVLLKGRTVEPMVARLREILGEGRTFRGLPVRIDVDPV